RMQSADGTVDMLTEALPEVDRVIEALLRGPHAALFDGEKLGVGGISAGGMVTLRRLCEPHGFSCAAVEATTGWLEGLYFPTAGGPSRWPVDHAREAVEAIDPMAHLDGFEPVPLLALHSEADELVPFSVQQRFIERLREHYGARGGDPAAIELKTWPKTGAPQEHLGFGRFSNEAKNLQEVWAWGMFDFANQSFTLLIITLLFGVYVTRVVVPQPALDEAVAAQVELIHDNELEKEDAPRKVQDAYDRVQAAEASGKLAWSLMQGTSLLIVVAVSPFIGAWGDIRGRRKLILMTTGVACGVLTCMLGFVGPGMVILAAALYIPANICYQVGENFLASFLPDVSTRRTIGRISAIGWTMGYLGALALLIIVFGMMLGFGLRDVSQWRVFFVFAGVWFLLGIIAPGLILKKDRRPAIEAVDPLREAVRRVRKTLAGAGEFGELRRFLVAFLVYGFGVQTFIAFAAIIARDFNFTDVLL
ncbi:Uncharacterized MFS-type transporter YxiO, partial [Durusdinium trenchii]